MLHATRDGEPHGATRIDKHSIRTSRRGSIEDAGLPPSLRPPSVFLERVDEEKQEEARAAAYTASDDALLWSSSLSPREFTSDEEVENRWQRQTTRKPISGSHGLKTSDPLERSHRRGSAVSQQRSSTRQPLYSIPKPDQRVSRRLATNDRRSIVSTVDAKKQKKYVALFYWRRKTLETFLAAWKRVVFTVAADQRRELELLRPYAPPASASTATATRRLTNVPQPRSSVPHSVTQQPLSSVPHRERMRSLREEYRQLKAVDLEQQKQQELALQEELQASEAATAAAQRSALKERLRGYFVVFSAWRRFVQDAQSTRTAQEHQAISFHSHHFLRRIFDFWARTFMSFRHDERIRRQRAQEFRDRQAIQKCLAKWKKYIQRRRLVARRVEDWQCRGMVRAVSTWRRWATRTALLKRVDTTARKCLKRRFFGRIKRHTTQRRHHHQSLAAATQMCLHHRIRHAFSQWSDQVFASEQARRYQGYATAIACHSAVTKWKRFLAARRAAQERALQADYYLYHGLQRRCWMRWRLYHQQKDHKRNIYSLAASHCTAVKQWRAIHALLANKCTLRYERDRLHGAAFFDSQRHVRHAFLTWHAHATRQQKAMAFCGRRGHRSMVLCFVSWKQATRKLKRLGTLGDRLKSLHRSRILKMALGLWQDQRRLHYAFAIIANRHKLYLLHDHARAWRVTAAQQQTHRELVHNATTSRTHHLTRRILKAWRCQAVTARCRRALIRLFQKKQCVKKLQQSVRRLHLHAKWQSFQARLARRRVASTWHCWVVFTMDQDHQRQCMALARHFFLKTRSTKAVAVWKQNTHEWVAKRRNNHIAWSHFMINTMRRTLYLWYRTTRTRQKIQELLDSRALVRETKTLRVCVTRWATLARQNHRKRVETSRLYSELRVRRQQQVFSRWAQYAARRTAQKKLVTAAVARHTLRSRHEIFHTWRVFSSRQAFQNRILDRIGSKIKKRTKKRKFDQWLLFTLAHKAKNLDFMKATAFHREFVLISTLYGWQHAALAAQMARAKMQVVSTEIAKRRQRQALVKWKTSCHWRHIHKALVARGAVHFNQRRERKTVHLWRCYVATRTTTRHVMTQSLAHANRRLLTRFWLLWLSFTARTRLFKRRLRAVFQTSESDRQRRVWKAWRRYKRMETLQKRADAWQRRHLTANIFRHWKAHVLFAHKMKSHGLVANRFLQSNALRASFSRWKDYVSGCQSRRLQLHRSDFHHVKYRFHLALKRLRTAVRHAHAMEKSSSFHVTHALRQQFKAWQRGVKSKQQMRANNALVVATYTLRHVQKSFFKWKTLVEAKQQVLTAKAVALADRFTLTHVLKAWRRIRFCHFQVALSRAKRTTRVVTFSFHQWRLFRDEQQLIRRHVQAAVAHVDRVIMAKVWHQWGFFVRKRRNSHELRAVARAFYSKHVLQRPVFLAWRLFLHDQQEKYALRQQSEAFCIRRILRKSFGLLEWYTARRHARAKEKLAEDGIAARLVMKRAVLKWHTRARRLAALALANDRAMTYNTRRHLSSGVAWLSANAAFHRHKQVQQKKATEFRIHKSTQQVFGHWRAFINWRKRHKNLVVLFQTNQQADFFARWRKYVSSTKRKRHETARAIHKCKMLLQNKVLTLWKQQCLHAQAKRRAIVWYKERSMRRSFDQWASHASVLKKMRRLFQYQHAFRLETHFHGWKHHWNKKRQQLLRIKETLVWYSRHRQTKSFALWVHWLHNKQQEKETLLMAVKFRHIFFSRKYFALWQRVCDWQNRKKVLFVQAKNLFELRLYHHGFRRLKVWNDHQKALRKTSLVVRVALNGLRIQRAVGQWKDLVVVRREQLDALERSKDHYDHRLLHQGWATWRRWWSHQRHKNTQKRQAETHLMSTRTRNVVIAWKGHIQKLHHLRGKLEKFKVQYLQNVVDQCFFQWQKMVCIKEKLRKLKRQCDKTRQRQILHRWHLYRVSKSKMQQAACCIQERQRRRILRQWMAHWEAVATDSWMYSCLVRASRERRGRRIKRGVMKQWRTQVVARRARKAWRVKARARHATQLKEVLHAWHGYTVLPCGYEN